MQYNIKFLLYNKIYSKFKAAEIIDYAFISGLFCNMYEILNCNAKNVIKEKNVQITKTSLTLKSRV